MGLNVGMVGAEYLFRPVDGQLLDVVGTFAAVIKSLAGQSLGVLVCQCRSSGLSDGARGVILRGNEVKGGLLASFLGGEDLGGEGVDGSDLVGPGGDLLGNGGGNLVTHEAVLPDVIEKETPYTRPSF